MTHHDVQPLTLFIAPPLSAYKIHCLMGACNTYLFYFYHLYMALFIKVLLPLRPYFCQLVDS